MPQALSHTCIPAKNVAAACIAAIDALQLSRTQVRTVVEQDWLKTWTAANPSLFRSAAKTIALAAAAFPEYMKEIWEQYRKDDEKVLKSLKALCEAASAQGDDFTIEMTADDFRLLHDFYKA